MKYVHEENGFVYGFWALARPMTKTWGSGAVWKRLVEMAGEPDVAFGKTDGIPEHIKAIDKNTGFEWSCLPFVNYEFKFGYWDPPYDKLYKKEGQEIWRTVHRLAILHTHVYPTSWFVGAKRTHGIAVTMGPLKQIRLLQIFERPPRD